MPLPNGDPARENVVSDRDVAIVVASRDRPLRLRWLLNALSEQAYPAARMEVVVAHDSSAPDTERLLSTHALARAGHLRHLTFPARSSSPGAMRNAAWRATDAPLVLFTDDDCRPPSDWVQRAVSAAQAHPGSIVQGRTIPDPDEATVLRGAPWPHTMLVEPPTVWAPTCNIAYPRVELERAGGFDESLPDAAGEDTDLALRVRASGAGLVAAPEMLTFHAVHPAWLPARLRSLWRWQHMAGVVKLHPRLRRDVWAGLWWKREHAALMAALAAPIVIKRNRAGAALALPWLALSLTHRGYRPRGILRAVSELPGRAAIDATEIAALLRGSIRYRTVLL